MGEHGGKRNHRTRRTTMRELTVHFVGDRALLQHHDDVIRLLRQRRNMQINQPVAGVARRAEVNLVFVHGGAALAYLFDQHQQRAAERD